MDYIVVMKDGKISEQGTYQQLIDNQEHFSRFLLQYLIEGSNKDTTTDRQPDNDYDFASLQQSLSTTPRKNFTRFFSMQEGGHLQRNKAMRCDKYRYTHTYIHTYTQ